MWSAADGSALRNYGQFSAGVNSLEFSPDGSQLAAGYSDHVLRLWSVDRNRTAQ
ncbi:MAG: hypothetical protein KDA79_15165 [Planctomycetaceae bacterium]|nr:hypothetical protein [Planctomycetaceae bacterium]